MKRTSIPIPVSKSEMIVLAKKVLDKHIAQGDDSLVKKIKWETLRPAIEKAIQYQNDAENHIVQRKICIEERNKLVDEIIVGIRGCRNILSGTSMTSIQTLGEWGFDVFESNVSRTKNKQPAIDPVKPGQPPETKV